MTYQHVGDLAELYALGALDDRERSAIDAHVRSCPACTELVGSAERDVALVASMEPRHPVPPDLTGRIERMLRPPSSAWAGLAALAAALLVILLPSFYFWEQNRALHDAMLAQSAAMERIAAMPHRTANFRAIKGGPPAQVMYGPDGSWYVIVVRQSSKTLAVMWMHRGERTMLGHATPHGNLATLYLPKSHRMDRLALVDGDRIVAEATLTWQRTLPARQGARSG